MKLLAIGCWLSSRDEPIWHGAVTFSFPLRRARVPRSTSVETDGPTEYIQPYSYVPLVSTAAVVALTNRPSMFHRILLRDSALILPQQQLIDSEIIL
jgi:hypothetical protein